MKSSGTEIIRKKPNIMWGTEERTKQKVKCVYCDPVLKAKVTRLQGPSENCIRLGSPTYRLNYD